MVTWLVIETVYQHKWEP